MPAVETRGKTHASSGPSCRALIDASGAGALPYHLNPILGGLVEAYGRVIYKSEAWS